MKPITFALAKGRLAKSTMEMLKEIGITCSEMETSSRKLLFTSDDGKYQFFLSKVSDVSTYVEHGVADIGIVGKDILLENPKDVYEVMDMEFGKCRMCVAGPSNVLEKYQSNGALRVATTFVNIAREYFENVRKQKVEIIQLHGSVELGPIVGLADVIVDIVESGSTLRENGMVVLDEIVPISARLIVNPASMKKNYESIMELVEQIRKRVK